MVTPFDFSPWGEQMKAARAVVAGLVTLLLVWSAGATAPTAAAAAGDPVSYTTGCGFVELTSEYPEPVYIQYGSSYSKYEDGHVTLAPGAVKRIPTKRANFRVHVLNEAQTDVLQDSQNITAQNCPKVPAKTPRITGTKRVGQVLTATTPGWGPAGVTLSYQWSRSGRTIVGATAATYTLTASDKGKKIRVSVTGAHDGYYSVTKVSKKTAKVKAGILAPAPRPTVTGVAVVGTALTANPGVWGPAGVTLSYQWYRGGKKVRTATAATYTLGTADLGRKVTVKVTGRLAGYNTVVKTSVPTAKVVVPQV